MLQDAYIQISNAVTPKCQESLTKVNVTCTTQHTDPQTGQITFQNDIIEICVKEELEAAILANNKKHFAQAGSTLFTLPPSI